MIYLKLFNDHSAYEEAKDSLTTPNVAYDFEHVHFKSKDSEGEFPFVLVVTSDWASIYAQYPFKYTDTELTIPSDCSGHEIFVIYENGNTFNVNVTIEGETDIYPFTDSYDGNIEIPDLPEDNPLYKYTGKMLALRVPSSGE